MNNHDIDFIKSSAAILQQSSNHSEIIEILQKLEFVDMSIETLKSTRIGAIVNKLSKRTDLPSKIHKLAWKLVNDWKEIATLSVRLEQQIPCNKKRSLSQVINTDTNNNHNTTNTNTHSNNTNNSLNRAKKRQRLSTNSSNTSMFALVSSDKPKKVPSLQQICINVMQKNAVSIGKLPCELDGKIIQQIYGSLKPSELKKIYRLNPHLRQHLDILWRRQLINLNPNYIKRDDKISWFKAYQLYLLQRKDKYETAKQRLLIKSQEAKYQKQSTTKLLSKEEATIFKSRNNKRRSRKKYQSKSQIKKNKMMKDCMSFVRQRSRMFKAAQIVNNNKRVNTHVVNSHQQKSFVRRQKELRAKRNDDKNKLCQW